MFAQSSLLLSLKSSTTTMLARRWAGERFRLETSVRRKSMGPSQWYGMITENVGRAAVSYFAVRTLHCSCRVSGGVDSVRVGEPSAVTQPGS